MREENGYEINTIKTSRQLTKLEALRVLDTASATSLDRLINDSFPTLIIEPNYYAINHIINPHAKRKDNTEYDIMVIVTHDGEKYYTGSSTFIKNFEDLMAKVNEIADSEVVPVVVYKLDSKNYPGSKFLTCSIG